MPQSTDAKDQDFQVRALGDLMDTRQCIRGFSYQGMYRTPAVWWTALKAVTPASLAMAATSAGTPWGCKVKYQSIDQDAPMADLLLERARPQWR